MAKKNVAKEKSLAFSIRIVDLYKFLADFQPDQIVIAGDMLDFYELSSFDKDPKRKFCIQDEIDKCYDFLKELKEYCKEIHFIKGNNLSQLYDNSGGIHCHVTEIKLNTIT